MSLDELGDELTSLFLTASETIVRRLASISLPPTVPTRTMAIHREGQDWRSEYIDARSNTLLTGGVAREIAPWLDEDQVRLAYGCSAAIAEAASVTLPFWSPFEGHYWQLVRSVEDERANRGLPDFDLTGA